MICALIPIWFDTLEYVSCRWKGIMLIFQDLNLRK